MSTLIGSSNLDYHANRTHLSSSNLKMLLKHPDQFYQEWVMGQKVEQEERAVFTEGSFVHTLILEPEKVAEYVVFPGLRKSGKVWEEFKAANPGKTILSAPQVNRCEALYQSYKNTKVALELVQNGLAEHTMLSSILDVPVKARADYIVPGKYIVDVKTTSAPTDIEMFKLTIEQYQYDLSAALYCQIAFDNFNTLHDFYFVVLSKEDGGCAVYKASSNTLSMGAAKVTQSIVKYKKGLATGNWLEQAKVELCEEIEEV